MLWNLCFSSYKNRKLKVKLWWVEARERKEVLFVPFILSEGNLFNIAIYLSVYCIKYTFRIYILLHIKSYYFIHFLSVFKIVESLQCLLKIKIKQNPGSPNSSEYIYRLFDVLPKQIITCEMKIHSKFKFTFNNTFMVNRELN